jgi:hypothetical protein
MRKTRGRSFKVNRILRKIKNTLSTSGGCLLCDDKWSWKKPHYIPYAVGSGAFPVCEECWQTKTDSEIIGAAERLARMWRSDGDTDEHSILMVKGVEKALKERKVNT